MKTLVFLVVVIANGDLYAQSVLDALRQPNTGAERELLNQANQASQDSANAASKRANLLQRRAEKLRLQVDQLEKEVEMLRSEHAALKTAVIECRDQFVVIIELLEKQNFAAVAAPLEKLKLTYTKSLLPKLLTKEPVSEAEATVEAPVVVNSSLQSVPPKTEAPKSDAQNPDESKPDAPIPTGPEQPVEPPAKNSPDK